MHHDGLVSGRRGYVAALGGCPGTLASALAWTAKTLGLRTRKVTRLSVPRRPRALHPPAALREREGRRFAGEGCPPVPQPQALPADREARRRALHPPASLRAGGSALRRGGLPTGAATAGPPRRPRSAVATLPLAKRRGRVLNLGGPELFTLPRVFEREGRRFAGEGSPAVPQPQALPADREARRRPSRSRSAAGG